MTEKQSPTTSLDTVREVTKLSYEKLPPMPEKSAFMFYHNVYPKPKIDLKDTEISKDYIKITNTTTKL